MGCPRPWDRHRCPGLGKDRVGWRKRVKNMTAVCLARSSRARGRVASAGSRRLAPSPGPFSHDSVCRWLPGPGAEEEHAYDRAALLFSSALTLTGAATAVFRGVSVECQGTGHDGAGDVAQGAAFDVGAAAKAGHRLRHAHPEVDHDHFPARERPRPGRPAAPTTARGDRRGWPSSWPDSEPNRQMIRLYR